MATKKEEVEVLEAEVVDELLSPDLDFKEHSRKKPQGTRKKDFPAFTDKARRNILGAAEKGLPLAICANLAGVSYSTVQRWLQRGYLAQTKLENDEDAELTPIEQDFAWFYVNYLKCSAYSAYKYADIIDRGCDGTSTGLENPRLAMRWLEKTHPDHFAPRQRIDTRALVGIYDGVKDPMLPEGDEIAQQLSTKDLKYLRDTYVKEEQKLLEAGDDSEIDGTAIRETNQKDS